MKEYLRGNQRRDGQFTRSRILSCFPRRMMGKLPLTGRRGHRLAFSASLFLIGSAFCAVAGSDLNSYKEILSTISRRSEWPSARFAIAEIYFHSKQWDKAAAQWEKLSSEHPNDPLAPQALWRILTVQSGPENNRRAAIKTAQLLQASYPGSSYGERACFAEAMIWLWSKNEGRAGDCANRYLREYPQGHYIKAANHLLAELK